MGEAKYGTSRAVGVSRQWAQQFDARSTTTSHGWWWRTELDPQQHREGICCVEVMCPALTLYRVLVVRVL